MKRRGGVEPGFGAICRRAGGARHLVVLAGAAWASAGCFSAPNRAPAEIAPGSFPGSRVACAGGDARPAGERAAAGGGASGSPTPAEPAPEPEMAPEPVPDPVPVDPVTGSPAAAHHELTDHLDRWFGYWLEDYGPHMRLSLERMGRTEPSWTPRWKSGKCLAACATCRSRRATTTPRAYSRVGAAGMWQFMPGTARERGLTVNSLVDERRDPVVATAAALDMLADLHERFDSWFLALAAYNGGPNRVARLLRRHHSGPLGDSAFLVIRDHLPRETRHFVPKFLAAATIAEDPGAFGIDGLALERALDYDEVSVPDATSLDVVARAAGVPEEEIRAMNPHLRRSIVPAHTGAVLRLPAGTMARFERNYAAIPTEQRMTIVEHTISRGETLGHIAENYGVRLSELMAMNPGLRPRYLRIGQTVVVPRLRRVLAGM